MCEPEERDVYFMCEPFIEKWIKETQVTKINFSGFSSTWEQLLQAGWIFRLSPAYVPKHWKNDLHAVHSHEYMYIHHPKLQLIGRINKRNCIDINNPTAKLTVNLDYLHKDNMKGIRQVKAKIFEEIGLTVDDIPRLMDMILKIQASVKIRPSIQKPKENKKVIEVPQMFRKAV